MERDNNTTEHDKNTEQHTERNNNTTRTRNKNNTKELDFPIVKQTEKVAGVALI